MMLGYFCFLDSTLLLIVLQMKGLTRRSFFLGLFFLTLCAVISQWFLVPFVSGLTLSPSPFQLTSLGSVCLTPAPRTPSLPAGFSIHPISSPLCLKGKHQLCCNILITTLFHSWFIQLNVVNYCEHKMAPVIYMDSIVGLVPKKWKKNRCFSTKEQISSIRCSNRSAPTLPDICNSCCLIGPGRSSDEEDEVELYHMVVMAGVEQTH